MVEHAQLVVVGSGPGGYSAAFRAADLGLSVILIERDEKIGGVCLNVGCIPSKALLHVAKVIDDAKSLSECGVDFGQPQIDIAKILAWKNSVVNKLTGGLISLAKQRGVKVIRGTAKFVDSHRLTVEHEGAQQTISFDHCIIAVGSQPVRLPFLPNDERIFDSTGALTLPNTNSHMLVIGGGIIGLEMATVYGALGAQLTIVEFMDQLIPGADADVVKPLHKRLSHHATIRLKTKVTAVSAQQDGLHVTFDGEQGTHTEKFDQILCAVGRKPNGLLIDAHLAGVQVDERGFIAVNQQLQTNVPHIYAIGDVVGNPMLAHKAVPEGRIAAEVIAGKKHYFTPQCIPNVAYTDPELAWVGVTERAAKEQGLRYGKGIFPWAASGRALSMGRDEGLTKVIFDEETHRLIGGAVVGPNAGELIAEIALAIEMGCVAEDISLTIHPHPTLSETVMMATEVYEGTITDLFIPKNKRDKK